MNKLAIIDGDGLMYQSSKETLMESIDILDAKIQNIFDQTQATHYVIFISFSPYFRHSIDPNYKIGRSKYPQPLKWLKSLKSYLIEEYGAQSMNKVEADDLVAYWYNKKEWEVSELPSLWGVFTKIICSPDKDLLQSIPGKHFNYTYKLKDDIKALVKGDVFYQIKDGDAVKGWWVETTRDSAELFKLQQLIIGDIADGIKGVEGLGIKAWEKMINEGKTLIHEVAIIYILKYGLSKGIYEFQKNYRLLHLLDCDEDFIREVGVVPEFPVIKEIKKSEPIEGLKIPDTF